MFIVVMCKITRQPLRITDAKTLEKARYDTLSSAYYKVRGSENWEDLEFVEVQYTGNLFDYRSEP